ncbi:MAG: hypothetical protein ABSA12_03300 [Verrucomicrobiia bacterium]
MSLAENVHCLSRKYGNERIGFLTLTTPEGEEWEKFQGRFHSLGVRVLPAVFVAWLTVFEFSKKGRLHAHLVVACRLDIRTGFDFSNYLESVKDTTPLPEKRRLIHEAAKDCPNLRNIWAELRGRLAGYGFGRHELIPVRTTEDGIARYVGGYVSKCVNNRREENKGRRFVRYSQGWREWSTRFGWATPGGWVWRRKLELLAAGFRFHGYQVKGPDDLKRLFGPRWAYKLKDLIPAVAITVCPTKGHALADGVSRMDLGDLPSDAIEIGGLHPFPDNTLAPADCARVALMFAMRKGGGP